MEARPEATFDTSFWAHAFGAGLLLAVLRRYALRYTAAVAAELPDHFPSGREFRRLVLAGELEEVNPLRDRVGRFGPGERAAISVALEHRGWALLLDDLRALQWASGQGLWQRSTPLIVVDLLREGEVDGAEARRLLAELGRRRTLSQRLLSLARGLVETHEGGGAV